MLLPGVGVALVLLCLVMSDLPVSQRAAPNGLEICGAPLLGSRPASQGKYRTNVNSRLAASVENPRSEAEGAQSSC